jgi:hypothetical protein
MTLEFESNGKSWCPARCCAFLVCLFPAVVTFLRKGVLSGGRGRVWVGRAVPTHPDNRFHGGHCCPCGSHAPGGPNSHPSHVATVPETLPRRGEALQACQELRPHEEPEVDRAITEDETGEDERRPRTRPDLPTATARSHRRLAVGMEVAPARQCAYAERHHEDGSLWC